MRAHTGARVTDGSPKTSTLYHLLTSGFVLRAVEVLHPFPARLRSAKGLPVELHVESFVRKEPLVQRDEVVEAHPFRSDFDVEHIQIIAANYANYANLIRVIGVICGLRSRS